MGIRGPAPKNAESQATKSKQAAEKAKVRVVRSDPVPPPELPEFMPVHDPLWGKYSKLDELLDPTAPEWLEWPEQTRYWWECWTNDPLTADYRHSDWLDLLDCATIHGRLWSGEREAAAELRLRMAKHGATREDRAKMRIVFATADITEAKADRTLPPSAREGTSYERRGALRSVK